MTPSDWHIDVDDLSRPEVIGLLDDHMRAMEAVSPPESRHALSLEKLRAPDVTFWTVWDRDSLVACGALKQLDPLHGEIKSMRTALEYLRKGAGAFVLRHIIQEAKRRRYRRLSLETGSMDYFEPARRLYLNAGFSYCAPFGAYVDDANSVFMTLEL